MNLFKSLNKRKGLGGTEGAKFKPRPSSKISSAVRVWVDKLKIFTVLYSLISGVWTGISHLFPTSSAPYFLVLFCYFLVSGTKKIQMGQSGEPLREMLPEGSLVQRRWMSWIINSVRW